MQRQVLNMHRPVRRFLLVFVAACFVMLVPSSSVSAIGFVEPEEITNKQKAHIDVGFTGGGEQNTTCESTASTNLRGSENLEKVFNFFLDKGLSPEQSAAIVGNIAIESGGNPINAQVGPDTKNPAQFGTDVGVGKAWGLIQWDAGGRSIQYAEKANITEPIYELSTQLDLVWWHMNNESPTSAQNMYEAFKNITGLEEATQFYEEKMEGAGEPHMEDRIERAKEALRMYGGGGSETGADTPEGPNCNDSEGGVASANGFTFPLKTTQKAIKNNSWGKWCYADTSNCHHDYNAADLMITTGTTVIAAKAGKVQNVNSGNQHPNNITIKTDDGEGINYYTHLGANTVTLRVGQKVGAGKTLGKVGTTVDALNTGPHLHFDMLPPQFSYRPSCSSEGCKDYPFIEVQPALIETFHKLPES